MQTKKPYHLKAFTMQELLVGMVVSSLIIGMMYTIYAQINKQLFEYNTNQEELMSFNQFRQVLSKDIQLARDMERKSDTKFEVIFADKKYTYFTAQNKMIRDRHNGIKDTFTLMVTKMELNKEINDDFENQTLTLTTSILNEELVLFENKNQSVAKQVNRLFLDEY